MERKKQNVTQPHKSQKHVKAATNDIIPPVAAKPKINRKWERPYRRLSELRDYLLHQKGALSQDAKEEQPSFSEHMADAGTDSYDRDFALSILSADQNALYEVEEALRRIESGTYGKCELTGKPIPAQRLDAVPWARFIVEAEKQLEENGEVNHAHLAPVGSVSDTTQSDEEKEIISRRRPREATR